MASSGTDGTVDRTVVAGAVLLVGLAMSTAACGAMPRPETSPTRVPSAVASGSAEVALPPDAASGLCPDAPWPPFDLGGVPGITATSIDRATAELSNRSGRTWYYSAAAWTAERLETCIGAIGHELQRGPVVDGATERVDLSRYLDQPVVPITIAFWDAPCGEACDRDPVGGLLLARSPVEPASS
jgi:hypothetical protein